MAQVKTATVVAARAIGADTRLVELAPSEPLGFTGGQYLIVNSGVALEGGKLAKRAYSLLSPDARQERVEIAVKRVGAGPGSSFMHAAEVGAELPFSGPWGQYLPDDSRPRETWVIATDTGITCALGLVRGHKFAPQRAHATLAWLVESRDYFLPQELIREPFTVEIVPPVGHAERVARARAILDRMLGRARPESVFLSGDGAILMPLKEALVAAGVDPAAIRVECFFNNPAKKSP